MKARLKDMKRGDRFWFCGVIYEIKKISEAEIKIGAVDSRNGTVCTYGRNCMMWVEIIENESKKAA